MSRLMKIFRGLSFRPQDAAPSNPSMGDVYCDLTGKLQKYDGSAWAEVGGATVDNFWKFQDPTILFKDILGFSVPAWYIKDGFKLKLVVYTTTTSGMSSFISAIDAEASSSVIQMAVIHPSSYGTGSISLSNFSTNMVEEKGSYIYTLVWDITIKGAVLGSLVNYLGNSSSGEPMIIPVFKKLYAL